MYVCIYAYICVNRYIPGASRVGICGWSYEGIYVLFYVSMYVCMYVCMHVCVHVYIHVCISCCDLARRYLAVTSRVGICGQSHRGLYICISV